MLIQLDKWVVSYVNLDGSEHAAKKSFELKVNQFFPEKPSPDSFGINFEIKIQEVNFNLNINVDFFFKTDEPISEEFKLSDFTTINAPSIAFPYLRSYISNLTLQSGYDPVILPSINFIALSTQKKLDKTQ